MLVQSYFIHTHSFDGLWFVGTDSDAHVAENEKERDVLRWFSVVFGHGGTGHASTVYGKLRGSLAARRGPRAGRRRGAVVRRHARQSLSRAGSEIM